MHQRLSGCFGFNILFLLCFLSMPTQAQTPDATQTESLTPPVVTVKDFIGHMDGAQAAELDMQGFLALRAAGAVTVLDVRSKTAFDHRHIKGAINLPVTDMTEHTLPTAVPDKTTPVVLVCDFSFFPTRMMSMTMQAWPVLRANGYTNVYRLNLWQNTSGGNMVTQEEQEKHIAFETTSPAAAE